MRRMVRTGRFANVTALLALVVALSGSAYAATKIRSGDIVNGQVKRADLGTSAVTSLKVRNGTLLAKDFEPGQLRRGPAGPAGAPGPAGPPGPGGVTGATGAPGLSASASANTTTPSTLASSGSIVLSATLTTPAQSRLVATGAAEISSNGGDNDQAFCYLRDGSGDVGMRLTAQIPAAARAPEPTGRGTLSPTGGVVRPAGNHTVQLVCGANAGGLTFQEASLTVVAAAP